MPRKFHDEELVGVRFSTRRLYTHFLGRVENYQDGKYLVRCLASGDRPLGNDLVFVCRTSELYQPTNTSIDDVQESTVVRYNKLVESQATGSTNYQGRISSLLWASFSLQRLRDRAWSRRYPVTHTFERSDYVC